MSRRIDGAGRHEPGSPARATEWGSLLVFLAVGAVYALTLSRNLSIAHDSVSYASRILSFSPHYHPNHLLYEPFLSGILWLLSAIGVGPSLLTLEAIGAVTGAAAVAGAYKILVERFGVGRRNAALTVIASAATFGVWYYSVGVEIYIYPLVALTWCFYVLLGTRRRDAGAVAIVAAAALHSLAILFHQTSILFALVPILVLLGDSDRRWAERLQRLALYGLVGSVLVGGTYAAVVAGIDRITDPASFFNWFLGYGTSDQYWSEASPKALLLGLVGFGRAVIGGHFLFGLDALRATLNTVFPNNDLADEAFLLHQVSNAVIWLLLAGSVLWGGLVLWTAASVVRAGLLGRRPSAGVQDRQPPAGVGLLLAWFVPYALFFIAWDAVNVDFWVNQVFVIWMIVGVLVDRMLPAAMAAARLSALALGLIIINGAGTILPAANQENDFITSKVLTLTGAMQPDGVLVIADDWPDGRHIRFRTGLDVIAVATWPGPEPLAAALRQHFDAGRPVYLWPDVQSPSPVSMRFYGQDMIESVQALQDRLCGTAVVSAFAGHEAHEVTCLR